MRIAEATKDIDPKEGVTCHPLGEIIQDPKPKKDGPPQSDEYVVIGLWKLVQSGQMECYKEYKVPNPLFTRCKDKMNIISRFLWTSEENRVFFFSLAQDLNGQSEVVYTEIDLEQAMRKDEDPYSDESSIQEIQDYRPTTKIPTSGK